MESRELQLLLTMKDQASKELAGFNGRLESLEPTFRKIRNVGAVAFTALSAAIGLSVKEAMEAETVQSRLATLLRTTNKGTDEQIDLLFAQAKALEKVGVVSTESIINAQAQLATFDLQAETIQKLTPAILDYVVAEKGAGASTDELRQMTNGLAQALNGNFSSLTRTGFVLDDTTKNLIANGTEAERAAALVSVLNSTYEGFNEKARETTEGSLFAFRTALGDISKTIGETFIPILNNLLGKITPIIEKISVWVENNKELTSKILMAGLAVAGLLTVIGTLGLLLPAIIAGFTFLVSPIGLVITGISVLIATTLWLNETMSGFFTFIEEKTGLITILQTAWDNVVLMFTERLLPVLQQLWEELKPLQPFLEILAKIIGVILYGAFIAVVKLIEVSVIATMQILTGVIQTITSAVEFFKNMWDSVIETLSKVIDFIDRLIEKIKSLNILQGAKNAISSVLGFGGGKASGGSVSANKSYLVGEEGPELFTPGASGAITPNNKLMGSGGASIVVNVYGDVSGQELIQKVSDGIMNSLRLNGRLAI